MGKPYRQSISDQGIIGSYTPIEGVPDDCFVYVRQFERQQRLIALNLSGAEQQVHLPEMGSGNMLISTHLDRREPVELETLRLRGDEGCIIEVLGAAWLA